MSLAVNTSPTLTDMSDRLNLMDARARLDRALDRGDEAALAAWARAYGASALEAAETIHDTDDLEEAQEAANNAELELQELRDTVEEAVKKIVRIMESDDCSDALANRIGPIVSALAEAA